MTENKDRSALIKESKERFQAIRHAVGRTIVGQRETVDLLLTGLLAEGHILLVGVPGLAKTLLVKALAHTLGWKFQRIQFTPDLMPADILGSEVIQTDPETGDKSFRFVPGPVFTNFLLADEINRTPPKTQSALLEAMQEYTVTTGGTSRRLAPPFMVVATQNPIEQEGTYPLPEAQLDRFLLSLRMDYPTIDEEERIASQTTGHGALPTERAVDITDLVGLAHEMPAPPHVVRFAVRLARATRPQDPSSSETVKKVVRWGAGPRASQHLLLAAKARTLLDGRFAATRDDVAALAKPVLRHRVFLRFNALSEGIDADEVIDRVLEKEQKN